MLTAFWPTNNSQRGACVARALVTLLLAFAWPLWAARLDLRAQQTAEEAHEELVEDEAAAAEGEEPEPPMPIAITPPVREQPVDFQKEVLPILAKNCLACHNAAAQESELVLETPQTILRGGSRGPAVVAKDPAASSLLRFASHAGQPVMPPLPNKVGAKDLTSEELGLIQRWIEEGATGEVVRQGARVRWRTQVRGPAPIFALATSADGQLCACSRGNRVFVYHLPSGQLATELVDPSIAGEDGQPWGVADVDSVRALAIHPAGDLLATGGYRSVRFWRRPRNVVQFQPETLANASGILATSPDGKTIAIGAADHTIQLWDLGTRQAGPTLVGHQDVVTCLQFSRDGQRLFSGSVDTSLRVWNTADGATVSRMDTGAPVRTLSVLAEGKTLASAGEDRLIHLWNVPEQSSWRMARAPADSAVVAIAPNQEWMALAGQAGKISLIDVASGKLLRELDGHQGAVLALAVNAAGDQLASVGSDQTVRLWSLAAEGGVRTLRGGLAEPSAVAFDPSGQRLVSGNAEGDVFVWNLTASAPRTLEPTSEALVRAGALSPDGKRLASAEIHDGRPAVVIRDLETGVLQAMLLGHTAPIGALAWNPNQTFLASGSEDQTVRVWNLADVKLPESTIFRGHQGSVRCLAFSADGTQVVSGGDDLVLRFWSVADGVEIRQFAGHTQSPVGICLLPGGTQIISAAKDGTLRYWNPTDAALIKSVELGSPVDVMVPSRDATRLAVACADHAIRIMEAASGAVQQTLTAHTEAVQSLHFSVDASRLVSAGEDRRVIAWDTARGRPLEVLQTDGELGLVMLGAGPRDLVMCSAEQPLALRTMALERSLVGHQSRIASLAFGLDGTIVFSAAVDGLIRCSTAADGQLRFELNHGAALHMLALSADGQWLATAGDDRQVRLWSAANGQPGRPLAEFKSEVSAVCFSADSRRVVGSSTAAGDVRVFDVASGELEQGFARHTGSVLALASVVVAQPEGEPLQAVASVGADQTVRIWPLIAGRRLAGHTANITCLATLAAANESLLSGAEDGTVRQWNLTDGQLQRQYDLGGAVQALAARPDGKRIAAAGMNRVVRLWDAENAQLLAELKGDFRAAALVARLTEEGTNLGGRLAAAQQALTAAETDAPVKAEEARKQAEAKATAVKAHEDALAIYTTASGVKKNAEALAFDTARAAQKTAKEFQAAEKALAAAESALTLASAKAAQAQTVLDAKPGDEELTKAKTLADEAVATATKARETALQEKTRAETANTEAQAKATAAADQSAASAPPAAAAQQAEQAALVLRKAAEQTSADAESASQLAAETLTAAKKTVDDLTQAGTKNQTELQAATERSQASEQPIRSLAFSANNVQLASAGDDQMVHLWNADTGTPIETYAGQSAAIRSLAFGANQTLVSGSAEARPSVWEVSPGWHLERTIGGPEDVLTIVDRVLAMDFSPDGTRLVTVGGEPSRSGQLQVWNVLDGSLVFNLPEAHTDAIFAVQYSRDGRFLATGAADKAVRVFDADRGEFVQQFEGHTHHVLGVTWRFDGKLLASCGADSQIKVWNVETGEQIVTIGNIQKHVTAVRFIGETSNLVSCAGDKLVRLHQAENGQNFLNFFGAKDYLYAATATRNGQLVLSGGHDGVLHVWNGANGQELFAMEPPGTDNKPADEAASP